jgi:predicted transcriptional regulator
MSTRYAIELDDALAERLEEAARNSKLSAAALITECVIQHLEVAIRHRALIDRLDAVDQGLIDLASFVGEATAGGNVDLSNMCRYSPPKA